MIGRNPCKYLIYILHNYNFYKFIGNCNYSNIFYCDILSHKNLFQTICPETVFTPCLIGTVGYFRSSNGMLDPWSSGGVLKSVSPTVRALLIPDAAHHLDLRAANPNDTQSVIHARKHIKNWIRQWIVEYRYWK